MGEPTRAPSTTNYDARVNKVIDYIEAHLSEPLTLAQVAQVAAFSPYHFHRLFRALVGEPLGRFIQRLRLERAASSLLHQPRRAITEIALDAGFSGSDTFARAFRSAFEVTPSAWRRGAGEGRARERKIGMSKRKAGQVYEVTRLYPRPQEVAHLARRRPTILAQWRLMMGEGRGMLTTTVEVIEREDASLAYLRHIGPYQGDAALFGRLFEQLYAWAGPRGLLGPKTQMMSVYHDDPNVTAEGQLRLTVGVTVPAGTPVEEPIGLLVLPAGRYAVARFELDADQYGDAWTAVMGGWLPKSGYEPDDRPSFEVYQGRPEDHPEGKHIVDICVPIRPARG